MTAHGVTNLLKESQFLILKKCQGNFDCIVYEMLFIKQRNPSLNTQTDSIEGQKIISRGFTGNIQQQKSDAVSVNMP